MTLKQPYSFMDALHMGERSLVILLAIVLRLIVHIVYIDCKQTLLVTFDLVHLCSLVSWRSLGMS